MKIYTGNFANVKKYEKKGIVCISIALTAKYFNGISFMPFAPSWSYMKDPIDSYTKKFNSDLEKLDSKKTFSNLALLSGGNDVVLLCHEKQGEFCHRQLVAKWIEKKLGIEVKELGNMEPVKLKIPIQFSLF